VHGDITSASKHDTGRSLLSKFKKGNRLGEQIHMTPEKAREIQIVMNKVSDSVSPFFTKETVQLNSRHVTGAWWQVAAALRGIHGVADVESFCIKAPSKCIQFGKTIWEELPTVKPLSW